MKEKDLDKNLENIIIDGLIKEAEQDNADFAAAMRKMSNEEFESIVREPALADCRVLGCCCAGFSDRPMKGQLAEASSAIPGNVHGPYSIDDDREISEQEPMARKSRFNILRPWIAAAVSAAAVILIVLIPSINSMNAKLCDSALYMSDAYITAPKGGFDVSSASTDEIKAELPNLKRQYERTIEQDGKTVQYHDGFQDAGWTLAIAYLRLHKKSDAIKVLETLESQTKGTPFGDHCAKMLEQLD